MNFRSRKFSDFSEHLNRRTSEKGRSKSDALYQIRHIPIREEVFDRKSYDGQLLGNQQRPSNRRVSFNIQRTTEQLRLPSIVSNLISRRLSLNVSKPIEMTLPAVYNSSFVDKRALFKTRSTQNFSSMTAKKMAQINKKGGRRMRRILSLDNFFPLPFKNRILPMLRFRRAVKTVLILLKVIRTNEQTSRHEVLSWAHDDITPTKRIYGLHGLSFDPSDYACRKEERLSNEAISILSMNPVERNDEQLKLALLALKQTVKAFGEFPIAMQKSLVRVGWYEKFEDKRVIIRQGHTADNFYLILSGKAIVTLMETDEETKEEVTRTKALLKKGNSFGELAIMHGSRRTATVTCKNEVELLAVCREDFVEIFMPHTGKREPEHIQFLRTVNALSGWPIQQLPYNDPKTCCFTYFRRGLLLCQDSNTSEWIYIIKTGSCRVLKELHYTKPLAILQNELKVSNKKKRNNKNKSCDKKTDFLKLKDSSTYKRSPPKCCSENIIKILRGPFTIDYESLDEHQRVLDAIYELRQSRLAQENRYKRHLDRHTEDNSAHSERDKTKTVFVHIQTLGPKDTYGLEQIAFGRLSTTTSTILVSDGAECILISKKFFLQHLCDEEMKKLRTLLQPLPSEEHMQQKLQDTTNWEAYKALTIKNHKTLGHILNEYCT